MQASNAKLLNAASKAVHLRNIEALRRNGRSQRQYSTYPVHESEFWDNLLTAARDPKRAAKILEEIEIIEHQPCIENERVSRMVQNVRSEAKLTLLKLQ